MPHNPKRSEQPPRVSDRRPTDPATLTGRRAGRPAPESDEPTSAVEPDDEFDDEFADELDESDDAPVR